MGNFILILLFFNAFFLFLLVLNIYRNKQEEGNKSKDLEDNEESKVLRVNTRSIEFNKDNHSIRFYKRNVNSLDHCEEVEFNIDGIESSNGNEDEEDLTEEDLRKELDEFYRDYVHDPFTDEDYYSTPTLEDIHNIRDYKNTDKSALRVSLSKCVGSEFMELLKKELPGLESLLEGVDNPDSISYSHTEKDVIVPSNVSGRKFFDIEKMREKSLKDKI